MMLRLAARIVILMMGALSLSLTAAEYAYSYLPKQVYATQVFPVTVLARQADPDRPVTFAFDPASSLVPLGLMPAQVINGHDSFYTFYFQAKGEDDVRIPPLKILEQNRTITLPPHTIHTETLDSASAKNFCGLIATDCSIRASQVSTFDANNTLVSLTIQAHEGNPEAIHIPGSVEEGIEKITRKHSTATAEFYFVIPSGRKSITLSYYNTAQHRFISKTIATDYHNAPVAAQVELNPKASPLDALKKYGTIALALFFALMFWWQKDRMYLFLFVILLSVIYWIYQPKTMLCVQEGSPLYILPTHNSRSSTTITEKLHTRSLGEHEKYEKINYRHGIIGWIRHEDLCTH